MRRLEDGVVLYDEAQGQLHHLSPVAGELIALMLNGQHWSSQRLAIALLEHTITASDEALVERTIEHFVSINIIDRLLI